MSDTAITHRPIAALTPWAGNARTHSRKQIRQIAASIQQFGFTNPVLIDEAGTILAGHGRVAAAHRLGMAEVPCLRLDHMNEDEKRAYVLADNKLALKAGWDEDLLAAELGALLSADLDFDVELTGFTIPEMDGILEAVEPEEPDDPRDDAVPDDAPVRVRPGAVWQLGAHRLICGDALPPLQRKDFTGRTPSGDLNDDARAARRWLLTDPMARAPAASRPSHERPGGRLPRPCRLAT